MSPEPSSSVSYKTFPSSLLLLQRRTTFLIQCHRHLRHERLLLLLHLRKVSLPLSDLPHPHRHLPHSALPIDRARLALYAVEIVGDVGWGDAVAARVHPARAVVAGDDAEAVIVGEAADAVDLGGVVFFVLEAFVYHLAHRWRA